LTKQNVTDVALTKQDEVGEIKPTTEMTRLASLALSVLLTIYALSTISFVVVGLLTRQLWIALDWADITIRVIFAIGSGLIAFRLVKKSKSVVEKVWPFVLAIFHFIIHPTGVFSSGPLTWAALRNLPAQGTGASLFSTVYITMDIVLVLSIILTLNPLRKTVSSSVASTALGREILASAVRYGTAFRVSSLLTKAAGLLLLVWAIVDITFIATGIVNSRIDITNSPSDAQAELLLVASVLCLLLRSQWKTSKVSWLVAVVVVWEFFVFDQILAVSTADSGLREVYLISTLAPLSMLRGVVLWLAIVAVFFAVFQTIIKTYASRVRSWIDNRIAELYKEESSHAATSIPRTTSILAVFSLIFAFVFPIVGLILAHAARNEIAISRGSKFGTDMTIAAAVISWLFIGIFAFALLALYLLKPLLNQYWLADLLYSLGF
jgi:hypothetical protein